MKTRWLLLILTICFLFSQTTIAQVTPPKVPDPFCSPIDFFKYLAQKNHDRVLYVVEKCSNIDLREKGPKGEGFLETLVTTDWNDIFLKVLNREDVNFQPFTSKLLQNQKFEWLKILAPKDNITFNVDDRDLIVLRYPRSKELLLQLINLKKIDLNAPNRTYKESILYSALRNELFDLVELLRNIPEVEQSNFYAKLCSFQFDRDFSEKSKLAFREYFKNLYKIEKIDVNLKCANGISLASNFLNNNIDSDLRDSILLNPALNFSAPTLSTEIFSYLISTYSTHGNKYFQSILGNPTFNLADKNSSGETFWHLLIQNRDYSLETPAFYKYFANLSEDTINTPDKKGLSPLYSYIKNTRSNPFLKKYLQSKNLDINVKDNEASALLNSLLNNNLEMFKLLLSMGADKINVGNFQKYHSEIISRMSYRPLFFDTFFNHPQLKLNEKITLTNQDSLTLYELIMRAESDPSMLSYIPIIINDPRFDLKTVESFRQETSYYNKTAGFTSAQTWYNTKDSDRKTLMKLIENSSNDNLNNIPKSQATLMMMAVVRGDMELVDYLVTTRKLPITAFEKAYSENKWDFVDYFIKRGYKPEFTPRYIEALLKNEKYDLLLSYVTDPSFDPNQNSGTYEDILIKVANSKGKAIFDLIINNPKTKINNRFSVLLGSYAPVADREYYFDAFLKKFSIADAEGKINAAIAAYNLQYYEYPISYLEKIITLKNFDINTVIPANRVYTESKSFTLYSILMNNLNTLYLDRILKIKALNPNTVSDLMPINALLSNIDNDFATVKKYFDSYYAHPLVKIALPIMDGVPFIDYVTNYKISHNDNYSRPFKITTLYLINPKFKFSIAEMTKIFSMKNYLKGSTFYGIDDYENAWLEAFFSHPAAKPLTQWSSIIAIFTDYSGIHEHELKFILKYGPSLDLNYQEVDPNYPDRKSSTLLKIAIRKYNLALFDYLITNPKVSVTEAVNGLAYMSTDFYNLFIEKRSKDIPQTEFLDEVVGISNAHENNIAEAIAKLKKIAPFIKSLDTVTERTKNSLKPPLAFLMKWKKDDVILNAFYEKLLKEDTTIAKNVKEVILPAILSGNYKLADFLVSKGLDLGSKAETETIMTEVAQAKSLVGLKYLASKGLNSTNFCNNYLSWQCTASLTPFGAAIDIRWYEGADYLLTLGFKPELMKRNSSSSMLYAVVKKDSELVNYLLSKKVSINATGSLVQALMDQNDELLEIFLNDDGTTDPNDSGYDEAMKRKTFPIIEAARAGRVDYVKALLQYPNIEKNKTDSLGYRAIDWAATNDFQEIVQLLKK